MIYVGIDDTDMPGTPGTNHFARAVATSLANDFECHAIVRHQLLRDPRVPCTSKNSAACLILRSIGDWSQQRLIERLQGYVVDRLLDGSDPGICVASRVSQAVADFGVMCQRELVCQSTARALAAQQGIPLVGCGGTEDGVIGALAAVGLAACGDDGRVVQIGNWPDDLDGWQHIATIRERHVEVRSLDTGSHVVAGRVDVGKHLRPNYRRQRFVLYAERVHDDAAKADRWRAVRLD